MSLVQRLSEERKQMNEESVNGVLKNILAISEACVKADKTSLHIAVRLDFDDVGNKLKVCVNNREVDNIDISSLLGTVEEKHSSLLKSLASEGFVDTTRTVPEYWRDECIDKTILSIGFDI